MGVTAENLAVKYDITREDSDNFSFRFVQGGIKLLSHRR